jgi:hypothetical protein
LRFSGFSLDCRLEEETFKIEKKRSTAADVGWQSTARSARAKNPGRSFLKDHHHYQSTSNWSLHFKVWRREQARARTWLVFRSLLELQQSWRRGFFHPSHVAGSIPNCNAPAYFAALCLPRKTFVWCLLGQSCNSDLAKTWSQ